QPQITSPCLTVLTVLTFNPLGLITLDFLHTPAITFPMDSREALVALNLIEHVGPIRARLLLDHFGEPTAILSASRQHLLQVRNIGEEVAEAIVSWEKNVNLAAELKRIADFGCKIVTQADAEYPKLLSQIYDPPLVLYVKGDLL